MSGTRRTAKAKPIRLTRQATTAARRTRIFFKLRGGMGVADIAQAEKLTPQSVRRLIAQTLARREVDPAPGYAQLQISRLNDVFLLAYDRMGRGDAKAIDQALRTIAHMDRYHKFTPLADDADAVRAPRLARAPTPRALPAPEPSSLSAAPPKAIAHAGEGAMSLDELNLGRTATLCADGPVPRVSPGLDIPKQS